VITRATVIGLLTLTALIGGGDELAGVQSSEPTKFLRGLSGEWSVVAEARLGPGQDPVRTESRETARLIGGRWLVAESSGTARGAPFTSILTLGYDDFAERFIGTWISGRQAHLWSYRGTLDASSGSLVLETEGPIHRDPTRTTRYREVIELDGPDRKVVRSMILGPDGAWFEFQRAEFVRLGPAGLPGVEP
jgi:hypothetical protein